MFKRITTNPNIQHGKPCIRNTRVPVYVIFEALAQGMDREEIKKEYPGITDQDILEVLNYGALLAREQEIELVAA